MSEDNVFLKGHNCWRESLATAAAPLIDCGNYYRALHQAICSAQHSIFIVGWDIDSRIELLRGQEAEASAVPTQACELLAWKARQNPSIQIYLLRWDSSLAFFSDREMWAQEVWDTRTPDNVHVWLDDTIPMGGSQHQKLVIIDDVIAFSGGMDISTNRWDTRDHLPDDDRRIDPDGYYPPLHDVQLLTCGPIVGEFAELVRWRWNRVAPEPCIDAPSDVNLQVFSPTSLPEVWPEAYPPTLFDMPCALARTIPFMDEVEPVQEVRRMLLDLINSAERFLYIENQFTTRQEIAEVLNRCLKEKPDLHLLIVSTYSPKNTFECEAFWASRIDFKKILESGVDPSRVRLCYSSVHQKGKQIADKKIHSKVMMVDDRYLVIGSSNISNRSMTLDTEVDLVFRGDTPCQREQLLKVRDDLLAEHTGHSMAEVRQCIDSHSPLNQLLSNQPIDRYHLREVDDSQFTDQSWQNVFQTLSDPEEPLIPPVSGLGEKPMQFRNPRKKTLLMAIGAAAFVVLLAVVFLFASQMPWFTTENLNEFLHASRGTLWALPTVCLVYVVGGLLFFPVTVLSLAVAVVYGPVFGPLYGICGALLSSALLFFIGHGLGNAGIRRLLGDKVKAVDEKIRDSGVVGIAAIRLLPVAPFSLVNLVAGISSVTLFQFLLGTFLGMFPPMIAKGLVGDSLTQIFMNPSPQSIAYLAIGIGLWIAMIVGSQKCVRFFQQHKQRRQEGLA